MKKEPKEAPLLMKLTDIILKYGTEKEKIWFFSKFLPSAFIISLSKLFNTNKEDKTNE